MAVDNHPTNMMRTRINSINTLAAIAIIFISGLAIYNEYREAVRRADHEMRTVLLGLAAHTASYSNGTINLLDRLHAEATDSASRPNALKVNAESSLAGATEGFDQLSTLAQPYENYGVIVDASVRMSPTSKPSCAPQVEMAEYRNLANSNVRLSSARCSNGKVLLQLTRKIQDSQGGFVGIAFVSLNADLLINYLRQARFVTSSPMLISSNDQQILEARLDRDYSTLIAKRQSLARDRAGTTVSSELAGASLAFHLRTEMGGLPKDWLNLVALITAVVLLSLGAIVTTVILLRRLLERHEAVLVDLDELKELKRAAEDANRAKSEYLAIMSHEIRTSMSGVLGMAEFMLRSKLYKEQHSGVRVLYESGQNLVQIINKVLDFSKIESGTLALGNVAFEPGELVSRVGDLYAKEAYNKGISLEIFKPSKLVWVRGDDLRIRQILANFVGNALKFTKQGGVSISLRLDAIPDTEESVRLLFKVRDTGPGIALAMQGDLFQPFHQARTEATREVAGTGLGLSICKRLSDLMNGKIWVESDEGVGSTFYLQLDCPIAKSTSLSASPVASEVLYDLPLGRASILLVEDNLSNQDIAQKYLERDGYTITCANDGAQAVELFKTERFDLILMDGSMPVMDGYEATKQIRVIEANEGRTRIPIIATTANTGDENEKKCLDAGMDDFVPKPYRFSDLRVKITKWSSPVDIVQ